MALISLPYTFVQLTKAKASEVMANLQAILDQVNGNLSAANLANGAVTEDKLGALAVAEAKIASGAVTDAKVAPGISAAKIGNGDVDDTKLSYLANVTEDVQEQIDKTFYARFGTSTSILTKQLPPGWSKTTIFSGKARITTTIPTSVALDDIVIIAQVSPSYEVEVSYQGSTGGYKIIDVDTTIGGSSSGTEVQLMMHLP